MADVNGEIFTTSGIPYQGWDAWTAVSGVSGTPGAPVTALTHIVGFSPFTLFVADSGGEVRETTTSDPPTMLDLFITSVTAQTINVSWSESNPGSVELDGFEQILKNRIWERSLTGARAIPVNTKRLSNEICLNECRLCCEATIKDAGMVRRQTPPAYSSVCSKIPQATGSLRPTR